MYILARSPECRRLPEPLAASHGPLVQLRLLSDLRANVYWSRHYSRHTVLIEHVLAEKREVLEPLQRLSPTKGISESICASSSLKSALSTFCSGGEPRN